MSINIDPKEFWITTKDLFKKNVEKHIKNKSVVIDLVVDWTFNLLLVYYDYRPACLLTFHTNYISEKGLYDIVNEHYPGVFKFTSYPDSMRHKDWGFIWCHHKPRNPTKLEQKKGTRDQFDFIGEILGYPRPNIMFRNTPEDIAHILNYFYYNIEKDIKIPVLAYSFKSLNQINTNEVKKFNNLLKLISDEDVFIQQQINSDKPLLNLRMFIKMNYLTRKGLEFLETEITYHNFSFNGRKVNLKNKIIKELYDILIYKWFTNKDNSGVLINLTEEDIKLIKKSYFKIFVFKKQEDKYLVKVNSKYDDEL